MNKKIIPIVIFVLTFSQLTLIGQSSKFIDRLYLTMDAGILQDFTAFTVNDNSVFKKPQDGGLLEADPIGRFFFTTGLGLSTLKNWKFEFGLTFQSFARLSRFTISNPQFGIIGSTSSSSRNIMKYNASVGYDLKLSPRVSFTPDLVFSYSRTGINGGFSSTSSDFFEFKGSETHLSSNNFFIGFKGGVKYRMNNVLDITFNAGYHQGLKKLYRANYELVTFESNEKKVFRGEEINKLSQAYISIGFQYNFFSKSVTEENKIKSKKTRKSS
jgi:hypothetical protein